MTGRRVLAIGRVEVLRLLHDRTSLALIFTVPAIQVLLFGGGAVQLNPSHVAIAIAGDAGQPALRDAVVGTGRFRIVADGLPPAAAAALLRSGGALVAIEVPPPRTVSDGSEPGERPVRVLVDAADPQEAGPALPQVDWLFNPARRTSWTLMPALAGVVVMISALLLGTLALVREREQGRWESLLASPATTADLILGKLLPYLVIAPLQAATVLLIAHAGFGVPLGGAVAVLIAVVPVFSLAHLLLGFAISAVARTQVQAIQGAVFFYLPCMLLSGFMFPSEAMPRWARLVGAVLPLTHFVRAARDVLLKGTGAGEVITQMLPVAGFALLAGLAASLVCGRRIE